MKAARHDHDNSENAKRHCRRLDGDVLTTMALPTAMLTIAPLLHHGG
jgi:hypothetical protein